MTKLKKQRKKKKFNYGRNKKRVRRQQEKTTKFNVNVDCKAMKDVWDNRATVRENMAAMGVALDANEVMPMSGTKKGLIEKMKKQKNIPVNPQMKATVTKPEVISKLEAEANVPKKQTFRFTTTQVQLITHLMDKHGTDYTAMSRDPKNHYQETPAKLKGMVNKFISIPEHYAPYCKERGLITASINEEQEVMVSSEDECEEEVDENLLDDTNDMDSGSESV